MYIFPHIGCYYVVSVGIINLQKFGAFLFEAFAGKLQ